MFFWARSIVPKPPKSALPRWQYLAGDLTKTNAIAVTLTPSGHCDFITVLYETTLHAVCQRQRVLPSLGLTQLRAGASLIDLVDVRGSAGKSGGAAAGPKRRNMDHFCVQLAEFSEKKIIAHLQRKGIAPGTVGRRYGALGHGPSMYLTDPDGNTVELKGPPDADQTEKIPDAILPGRRRKKAP